MPVLPRSMSGCQEKKYHRHDEYPYAQCNCPSPLCRLVREIAFELVVVAGGGNRTHPAASAPVILGGRGRIRRGIEAVADNLGEILARTNSRGISCSQKISYASLGPLAGTISPA